MTLAYSTNSIRKLVSLVLTFLFVVAFHHFHSSPFLQFAEFHTLVKEDGGYINPLEFHWEASEISWEFNAKETFVHMNSRYLKNCHPSWHEDLLMIVTTFIFSIKIMSATRCHPRISPWLDLLLEKSWVPIFGEI